VRGVATRAARSYLRRHAAWSRWRP
jgi:hypothetical protein